MRKINKHHPPAEFLRYVQDIAASYDEMDTEVGHLLRSALLLEQGGICAYCERRLPLSIPGHSPLHNCEECKAYRAANSKIEHHCERSICNGTEGKPDRRLDYGNLFVVCPGGKGTSVHHCDTKKADIAGVAAQREKWLPMSFNPSIAQHVQQIKYNSNGNVSSRDKLHDHELQEVLNLNAPILREKRQTKYGKFFRFAQRKDGSINHRKLRTVLEEELASSGKFFESDFPGMVDFLLRRFSK